MKRWLLPAFALIQLIMTAGHALAHPHVWIDNVTTFVFEGEQLTALQFTWTFDDFMSLATIRQFDRNRNGRFDPDEHPALEAEAFSNLRNHQYFVHIKIGGRDMPIDKAAGFAASIRDGLLIYRFTIPLQAPVDPAATEVQASVYDDSYFVEVQLNSADPVRFEAMRPGKCAFAVRDGDAGMTAFGVAPFQVVTLACKPAP